MKKQSIAIIGVIAFVLAVAVGYALFSETLTVNGTATAEGTFDVEFTSVGTPTCVGFSQTCDADTLTEITEDKNTLNVTVNKLEYPGAYVEIPVTVTNKGSIPAILKEIQETGLTTDPSIKVSYTGLEELKNQEVAQNGTQTFKIKVMWDQDSNQSSSDVSFSIRLNYEQKKA
ncbi:MAG TPA: hypothetical protein IAB68_00745 [Candidatus Aphodocola excrementigallinarum]|uniref:Uncharacterized protein n=1 Tax=Candidatus Aphodocola excrementigallinarum TaxID=2840670 RepID=A0A9D1ILH4_9FIRM|nr:hypothetical protein [Candidatus Aphodocola excrementigallinarum]